MDREELIKAAQRLKAAHWEMGVAIARVKGAKEREQEALDGLHLCEEKFAAAVGLAFPIGALKIAEAILLVAEREKKE